VKSGANHIPSLLSSLLFILGGLLLLGISLVMGMAVLVALLTGAGMQAEQPIFLIAFGFEAILLFAAAFFSLQRYRREPGADRNVSLSLPAWQIGLSFVIAGVSLLIGYLIGDIRSLDWLFLPLLTIPAIVLPLGGLLALGARGLPVGSRWQTWTVLGLAMTLGPLLLFALEILLAIFIFAGAVAYIMTQPELVTELQALSEQFLVLGPGADPEEALELLSPLLIRPAVMGIALLYIAVLVPAIEEIFKPIGVWLFAGKIDSPARGFALGALSGAGYALIETIGVSGQQTAEWASLLSSRIGTGLLHITTSALMGAAIVLAWRRRRFLRLLGTYLLAVLLHGLWNALAMLFTFSAVAEFLDEPGILPQWQSAVVIAMGGLAVILLAILVLSNRGLRTAPAEGELVSDLPPQEIQTDKPS
jgi:hypothetical protein